VLLNNNRMELNESQLELLSNYTADISKAVLGIVVLQLSVSYDVSHVIRILIIFPSVALAGIFLFFSLQCRKFL
jgi:hypothetical protein